MRLTALDGARGLFCLIVAMVHMPVAHGLSTSPFLLQAYPLLTGFFMLSGFVMAKAYGDMPATLAASGDMLLKRVARLWPLHIAALAFLVMLEAVRAVMVLHGAEVQRAPFTEGREVSAALENAFFVQSWGFGREFSWNYPSWTISTEFVAYLLLAAICCCFARVRSRCFAIGAAGVVGALAFAWESNLWRTHPPISMARCLMDFAAGYLMFYIWRAAPVLRSRTGATVFELVAFGAIAAIIVADATGWLLPATTLACAFAVYALANGRGLLSLLLSSRPMVWLGDVSVSVYLLHVPAYLAVTGAAGLGLRFAGLHPFAPVELRPGFTVDRLSLGPIWANDVFALALLGLVVALAAVTHGWFEAPARRAITRWGQAWLAPGHRQGAPAGV